jgi:hypothetical protein
MRARSETRIETADGNPSNYSVMVVPNRTESQTEIFELVRQPQSVISPGMS